MSNGVFFVFQIKMPKIRGKWLEGNMKIAMEKVLSKELSIREASEAYSVPKSTLGDRIKLMSRGGEATSRPCTANKGTFQRTFDDETEVILYNHVKALDNQLMPLSRVEFLKLVYQLAEKLKIKHRFNKENRMAGKDFYYDFMNRHQDLSLRTAESTSLQRAAGFNQAQVTRFFDQLETLIEKHNFGPSHIFNADETGVSVVHNNKLKVISVKGKKQVGKLTSAERGRNVTVLLSINATGDIFVPPLFVYPRVRIDQDLKKDAPMGSIFDGQKSGWITAEGFLKWMQLFVERVNPSEKNPVLLILDGHSSHKDLNVISYAKKSHIHMLSLPPHTSHKLQPLDRAVMKPFKNAYNEACALWMRKYPNLKISLKDIASLVNVAFSRICRMELAQSGFKCTGIHPFNRDVFSDLDFSASLISDDEIHASGDVGLATAETSIDIDKETAPVPSTSHRSSENVLIDISPLPSTSNVKFKSRGSRGEKSEILTSTPYKNAIEEKKQIKQEKIDLAEEKKKLRELKQNSKKLKEKSKITKDTIRKNKNATDKRNVKGTTNLKRKIEGKESVRKILKFDRPSCSKEADDQTSTNCIVCGEDFEEDWIQCCRCRGWSHENCAHLEGDSLFYHCDVCNLNV